MLLNPVYVLRWFPCYCDNEYKCTSSYVYILVAIETSTTSITVPFVVIISILDEYVLEQIDRDTDWYLRYETVRGRQTNHTNGMYTYKPTILERVYITESHLSYQPIVYITESHLSYQPRVYITESHLSYQPRVYITESHLSYQSRV